MKNLRPIAAFVVFLVACGRGERERATDAASHDAGQALSEADADASAAFAIVFSIDGARTLRISTSDGRTIAYGHEVSHARCYLLSSLTSPSAAVIDGDEALLMCAGGAQTDRASVRRTTPTSVEVRVFQKAFEAPDTPPSPEKNVETFVVAIPAAAGLRTSVSP
jgi:hypothetical protein